MLRLFINYFLRILRLPATLFQKILNLLISYLDLLFVEMNDSVGYLSEISNNNGQDSQKNSRQWQLN
jgi:hypothetical protein